MPTLKRCRKCLFMFLRARRRSSLLCKLAVNQVCFSAWLAVNRLDGLVVSNSLTRLFALHNPSQSVVTAVEGAYRAATIGKQSQQKGLTWLH